jgi:hypothetical protein
VLWASDASLANEKRNRSVEATGDGCYDDLESEKTAHEGENVSVLVVDSMDADDMDGRRSSEEDSSANGFKEIEFLTRIRAQFRVKEGNSDHNELCGHEDAQKVEKNLEGGPAGGFEETPCPRGENKCVPCGNS